MLRKVVRFVFQQKPQMVDEHDRPLHIISDGNRHSTRLFPLDVCVCVCVLDQDVCWDHVNVLFIQNPKKINFPIHLPLSEATSSLVFVTFIICLEVARMGPYPTRSGHHLSRSCTSVERGCMFVPLI